MKKLKNYLCLFLGLISWLPLMVNAEGEAVDYNAALAEFVGAYKTVTSSDSLEVGSDADSMTITAAVSEDVSYTVEFTYENGVLKYVPLDTTGKEIAEVEAHFYLTMMCVPTLAIQKGYDMDLLNEWGTNINFFDNDLTVEKDGIVIKTSEYVVSTRDPETNETTTESTTLMANFELDIVNGLTVMEKELEYANTWTEHVTVYPKTELFELFADTTFEINVENTENTMDVTMTDTETSESFVVNFTYEDGVVKYVPLGEVNSDNMVESMYAQIAIMNHLYALAEEKGYDMDLLMEWLETKESFTMEEDGMALEYGVYTETSSDDGFTSTITMEYAKTFELDIVNGLKSFEAYVDALDDEVQNPNTGISLPIGIGIMAVVVGGGVFLLRNKKYLKRG